MIRHGLLSLSVWLTFDISNLLTYRYMAFIYLIFIRKLPECLTQVRIIKVKQPENKALLDPLAFTLT